MHDHFDKHKILTSLNHGFRSGFSCESQLTVTLHDLLTSYDKGDHTDVIILDFSKAFDTVPHSKLLHKLSEYGINGPLHQWLTMFLTKRHMKVVVDGEESDLVTVDSGVPQGTVLGPILFLCHINDLPDCVRSQVRLFADDCLLYRTIKTQADHTILQNDLKELEGWAARWGMRFNAKKCYILSVRPKSSHFYSLDGHFLQQVQQSPYLGVQLSEDLKWTPHITKITGKASSMLGLLRRNLKFCPINCKRLAYISLVRSSLEYAASVWDPYQHNDIAKLEQIQRKAVRFISGDYQTREEGFITGKLEEFDLHTLQKRRKNIRLTLLFKIANGLLPAIDPNSYLTPCTSRRRTKPKFLHDYVVLKSTDNAVINHTRGYKLHIGNTTQYNNSFFVRTIADFNQLDESQVTVGTVDTFKASLKPAP